jgi:hypothetical protein
LQALIQDFAVDETRHRLFVISQSNSNVQYLSVYDVADARQIEEIDVSSGFADSVQIALNSRTRRIGIAESRPNRSGYTTDLYGCSYNDPLQCDRVAQTGQVSEIAIAGTELLAASGLLADDPHVCLTQINLATKVVAHSYCAPDSGVHYGVGVLDGKYIVGSTGASKWLHFKEETQPLSGSVSVWEVENWKVAAKAVQNNYSNGGQNEKSKISFACGRVSYFRNYASVYPSGPVPQEFHAVLRDRCESLLMDSPTDNAKP